MVGRGGGLPPDFFMLRNSLKRSSNAWKRNDSFERWVAEEGGVKGDLANCGDDILSEPTPTFKHIASATSLPILKSKVKKII